MERNLTLSSVMNLSAIKSMSDHLPATKDEMLKIQHVTVANYNKYGEYFLKITQNFREKHDAIQPLTELKRGMEEESIESFSDNEENDFDSRRFDAVSPPRNQKRGVKRKGGWGGKRGGYKKKRTYFKKKASPKSTKASSSGWKGKGSRRGGGGGGGLGLMPVHIK